MPKGSSTAISNQDGTVNGDEFVFPVTMSSPMGEMNLLTVKNFKVEVA